MFNRSAIMTSAHSLYRSWRCWQLGAKRNFTRAGFAFYLRQAWANAKAEIVRQTTRAPVIAPTMEERIDALKYLPFRYNIAGMEKAIRAEYATA